MEEGKLQVQPNIKKIKLKDGIERDYIDTYEKLYWIVNERFKEQKENNSNAEPIIDFSRLVICIEKGQRTISLRMEQLCGKIEGITNLGKASDLIPKKRGEIGIKNEIQFEVKYEISFENSIIYLMQFSNIKFLKYVTFSGTQFLSLTYIRYSIFFEDILFEENDISQNIEYDYKLAVDIGNLMFFGNTFKKTVTFSREDWKDAEIFTFSGNTCEGDVCFMYCSISDDKKHYYNFSSSIFKGKVIVSSDPQLPSNERLHRNDYLNKYNLFSHINFFWAHFHKELKINNVMIGDICMRNCHFDDNVTISRNYYDTISKLDFSFSTIKSLLFIDSDSGGIHGQRIKLSNEISFSNSLITKDAFILIRNINNEESIKRAGTLDFSYANLLGTVTIQDSKLDRIKLDKSTLIGDINIENVETEYDSRESIAKIKNEYFQRNDIVNLLFYKAKEMKYYSEHLDFKNKFITNIFRWFTKNWFYNTIGICFLPILLLLSLLPIKSLEKVREYTLLYLNRISNSFGMSWGQGVLFTCVTAWLFFALINTWGVKSTPLFVWGWNGSDSFGEVWKYYLHMFYLIDFKDKFNDIIKDGIIKHDSIELNALGDTLFFVSKIFVSYGIYQTISAFRKYGK